MRQHRNEMIRSYLRSNGSAKFIGRRNRFRAFHNALRQSGNDLDRFFFLGLPARAKSEDTYLGRTTSMSRPIAFPAA
eukprot:5360304-Pyramimonas_sp.AAC.1